MKTQRIWNFCYMLWNQELSALRADPDLPEEGDLKKKQNKHKPTNQQ